MHDVSKRAIWPSFFILSALLFALLISSVEGYIFWWAGIACLLITIIIGLPRPLDWTPLSIAVVVYVVYLLLNIFFLSPAFTAKGLYFVCYFAVAFFVFSRLSTEQIQSVFRITVAIFVLLSVWAIIQYLTGSGYLVPSWPRTNTIFYTPNTFAAAINLVLLPLIGIYLFGSRKKTVFVCVILLFSALILTQSRGGLLAFLFGFGALRFTRFLSREYHADERLWFRLVAGFLIIFCIFNASEILRKSGKHISVFQEMISVTRLTGEVKTGTERLKIYNIAWQRIKDKPYLGYGYNHFQYYQLSDQPLSRKGIITKFVHNDYLQIWMETGIVGLLMLLSIIFLFYYTLWLYLRRVSLQQKTCVVALLGGMTAYFAHAMVDFVMYPPVLLLMFGACLGITNSLVAPVQSCCQNFNMERFRKAGLRPSVLRVVIGIFLVLWLSQPAIAQLAFDKARRDVGRLDIESALRYFELARRFAAYEPAYYSAEGDIWYHAAMLTKDPKTARRADELLARGSGVNPYEAGNLFLRALLHRDLPDLLDQPVPLQEVLAWLEYVMQWNPHDNRVQVEYVTTLYQAGKKEEAMKLLREYAERYPKSGYIQNTLNYYDNLLK